MLIKERTVLIMSRLTKPWILFAVLLTCLLLASEFRWKDTASKNIRTLVIKYKTDRWTGAHWAEEQRFYANRYTYKLEPTKPYPTGETRESLIQKRISLLKSWQIAAATNSVILLLLSILIATKKNTKQRQETV